MSATSPPTPNCAMSRVTAGTASGYTDGSGSFNLANVPVGSYSVTASSRGYFTASQSVVVNAGATSNANIGLTKKKRGN